MVITQPSLELLGDAAPDRATLTTLVRTITGIADAEPYDLSAAPVDYQLGTPTTEALLRVYGAARGGSGPDVRWSCFVKRIQSVRHWSQLDTIPEAVREVLVAGIPWRLEIAVHSSALADQLPPGIRLATPYRIDERDDDRATIWMENVAEDPAPWDLPRFARAASLLGRLAARRRPDRVAPLLPRPQVTEPGVGLRFYYQGRVALGAIPVLADDQVWRHPLLSAADPALRTDLLALAGRMPAVLDLLDTLPQTYQHGDASPQNLLVPADDPDGFVAIDWGFDCPQAVGFDLGQLLIGLAHAGELDVDALPAVHDTILPAYTEGLHADGMAAAVEEVRLGYLGSLAVRAAFTAIPFELLGEPPTDRLRRLIDERIRLTRFLVDLVTPVVAAT